MTNTATAAVKIKAGLVVPGDRVMLDGHSWLVTFGQTGVRTRLLTLVRNGEERSTRPRCERLLTVVKRAEPAGITATGYPAPTPVPVGSMPTVPGDLSAMDRYHLSQGGSLG